MDTITAASGAHPAGLSPNSRSTVAARWARVQALSGLTFSVFATLHLVNTMLGALGPGAYNAFQRALRPIYQSPAVELGLILVPLVVHIFASVTRMRMRRGSSPASAPRTRAHRYAGYFLLTFVFGHIAATRLPPLIRGAYPEFEGVAYTFQWMPGWFYPYYTLLALAGLVHAAIGVPLALSILGVRVPMTLRRGPAFWAPLAIAGALLVLGVAGLGGLLFPVADMATHPYSRLVQEVNAAIGLGP